MIIRSFGVIKQRKMFTLVLFMLRMMTIDASNICSWSTRNMERVTYCPITLEDVERASFIKNCATLAGIQNCSDPSKFKYHCVASAEEGSFVEVCAPEVEIQFGYCATFNPDTGQLEPHANKQCFNTTPPCPERYGSSESYLYPYCYGFKDITTIKEMTTKSSSEDYDLSHPITIAILSSLAVFSFFLGVASTLCFIRLRRNLRQKENVGKDPHIFDKENVGKDPHIFDKETALFENVELDVHDEEQAKEKVEGKKDFKRREHDVEEGIFSVTQEDLEREEDDDDKMDTASVWSYFMPKRNFQYFFQHPYLRVFITFLVAFCNFLIYAEDPVARSMRECSIPLLGNDIAFVLTRYVPNAWSLLKVLLWLSAIVLGMVIGKLVVHGLFFNHFCRLRMFEDDMGSFVIMYLTTLISVFIFSWIYNAFLMIGGSDTEDYRISDLIGIPNSNFMFAAGSLTLCGNFYTAWFVIDMMLQEKLYPKWAVGARRWWKKGHCRSMMYVFFVSLTVSSVAAFFFKRTFNRDQTILYKTNSDFLHSNEVSRAILASFILMMDIIIMIQDWDFPRFKSSIGIKILCLNGTLPKFIVIPNCRKRKVWIVRITGKWFNYGILFLVMMLDMNMLKNQIFYYPFNYGQYTDSDGKIHIVTDDYSLKTFNETQLSYSYRSVTINPNTKTTYLAGDIVMNARYIGYHTAIRLVALIPAVVAFVTFGVLLLKFGRHVPHDKDVYAGRLKKRRRDGTKFRFNWAQELPLINLSSQTQTNINDIQPRLVSFELKSDIMY